MKLPKYILDQVSWWEYKVEESLGFGRSSDVIILHFKQWWKPRKKIKIQWRREWVSDDLYNYYHRDEFLQLRGQLEEYFKDK